MTRLTTARLAYMQETPAIFRSDTGCIDQTSTSHRLLKHCKSYRWLAIMVFFVFVVALDSVDRHVHCKILIWQRMAPTHPVILLTNARTSESIRDLSHGFFSSITFRLLALFSIPFEVHYWWNIDADTYSPSKSLFAPQNWREVSWFEVWNWHPAQRKLRPGGTIDRC